MPTVHRYCLLYASMVFVCCEFRVIKDLGAEASVLCQGSLLLGCVARDLGSDSRAPSSDHG